MTVDNQTQAQRDASHLFVHKMSEDEDGWWMLLVTSLRVSHQKRHRRGSLHQSDYNMSQR